ncbi:hypothetical protein IE987_20690 [Klebsiella pneumoniae]|uniref:Uncharacterized protein n=1 Tax=Klebsiella pneumoniae TaxID=573 RepID=A0A927DPR6_KLEPN|nr:hypothetical protein [Klebsiella pneumoniae]
MQITLEYSSVSHAKWPVRPDRPVHYFPPFRGRIIHTVARCLRSVSLACRKGA